MKKKVILFLTLSFFLFGNLKSQMYQDWKWLHQSPQGNDLRWVKMWDVNTIYAIGSKGTFIKTTDRGATWTVQHRAGRISGIPIQTADLKDAWFIDQNTGVVVGSFGSIFRTTNGGLTFDSTVNPAPTNAVITGVSFINNTTGFVISGQTNYRLLKTTDAGASWFQVSGSPPYTNPYHVRAFSESKIMVLNQLGDVCITTNGGAIWNTYAIGSQVNFYKTYFTDANTGYACGDWGRCRYTTNGGFNWINMSGALFDRGIHFFDIKARGNAVYMTGNSNYLWRSTNFGAVWDSIEFLNPSVQLPWSNYYYGIDFLSTSDTMIAVGSKGSVHQVLTTNKNTLCQYAKTGNLRDVWTSSSGLMLAVGAPSSVSATLVTHDQIIRSTNGGINWNVIQLSPTSVADFYSIDMIDDNTGFICGTKSAVYRTTNGGLNWDSIIIPNMIPNVVLSKVDFVNAQTGWIFSRYIAGNDSTIFKTTNGGENWTKQKLSVALTSDNSIYSACMIDENTGWLLNGKPRPWKTTNGGVSWDSTKLSDNYLAGSLYDIKMLNANTGYCAGSNNKVYKTINGGATPWQSTGYTSSTIITLYACEVMNPQECVVMGTNGTVYYTSNAGVNWVNKNPFGTIDDIYGSYLTTDGKLYATTLLTAGVHKNQNMFSVEIKTISNSVPDKFALMQNYPNPFNPSTNIKYQIANNGFVSLKIYNIIGKETATLVNEKQEAGTYEINWDAAGLPSGVYFCRMAINGEIKVIIRMLLIK